MKFYFSCVPESPSMESVIHLLVREAGGEPQFECGKVVTEYEGTMEDGTFKSLFDIYLSQPQCNVIVSPE